MEIGRPSTKRQTSRKSKKAWRKNIDLDEIDAGLEASREYERQYGHKASEITKADDSTLFEIDSTGDENLKTRRERNVKPLKMDEILQKSSQHPGLSNENRFNNNQGSKNKNATTQQKKKISRKELERLRRIAGQTDRAPAVTETQSAIEASGFESGPIFDPWDEDNTTAPEPAPKPKPTETDTTQQTKRKSAVKLRDFPKTVPTTGSFISDLKPAYSFQGGEKAPETLKVPPKPVIDASTKSPSDKLAVPVPDAGKSYNPTFEDWAALLRKEHDMEAQRVAQREKLEKEYNKLVLIIEKFETNKHKDLTEFDADEDNDDDDEESEDESEEQEDEKDKDVKSLSVNPPVKAKKKTKTQRNRQKRHQEKLKAEAQLKQIRQQIKQLENIPVLLEQIQSQLDKAKNNAKKDDGKDRSLGSSKRKFERLIELPLEIKLSDELTDSLRLLKPEGNLALEQFRSFQERGLIDMPGDTISKRRKPVYKEVEKLTYKYLFDN